MLRLEIVDVDTDRNQRCDHPDGSVYLTRDLLYWRSESADHVHLDARPPLSGTQDHSADPATRQVGRNLAHQAAGQSSYRGAGQHCSGDEVDVDGVAARPAADYHWTRLSVVSSSESVGRWISSTLTLTSTT